MKLLALLSSKISTVLKYLGKFLSNFAKIEPSMLAPVETWHLKIVHFRTMGKKIGLCMLN